MKLVDHFEQLRTYEVEGGSGINCQYIVKPGEMGLLSGGRIRLTGPANTPEKTHDGWDQVYVILSGSGRAVLDGKEYPVQAGNIVCVPCGTPHTVLLKEGEQMEYCYFNAFRSDEALKERLQQ
jgi:mannose-6-phosphate isomerase-like protein (cupin superfamily)